MQMIQNGYRGLSLVFDLGIDRILIGAEIAQLQSPPSQFMR